MAKPKPRKFVKPPIPKRALAVSYVPPWKSGVPGPATGVAEEDTGEPFDWSHISERQKLIRRIFVLEYLKDFNGTAAIARMGLKMAQPTEAASRWLDEPYTQFCFDRALDEVKTEMFVTRTRVIAGLLREANAPNSLCANSSSRVAAWGKLAKILGLEVTKIEADVKIAGGVMIVPMATNPDDWEKHAVPAQTALKLHAVA